MAFNAKGDLLTLIGDDVVIKTPGWDERIETEAKKFVDNSCFLFKGLRNALPFRCFAFPCKRTCTHLHCSFFVDTPFNKARSGDYLIF